MNKGKAATALAVAVALLALAALAVLPQLERNPYGVHEVSAAEQDATMEVKETGGGIDWDALPASVVAWVRVPGTTVDYPIVQGWPESPDFYLTHDAGGERSAWGAPYIDAGCPQGAESPLVIVYGHHMSDGTMFAPFAQYSSRDFAEGHRTIRVYTREKEIKLEVFAVDVVDASSEGKRTDFADVAELDVIGVERVGGASGLRRRGGARRLPRGQIVPVRGRPGRVIGRLTSLGLRHLQLPDEQLPHRRLREGSGRMGFAPFGIGLLMGLLTLTAYACCAAGDDDRD